MLEKRRENSVFFGHVWIVGEESRLLVLAPSCACCGTPVRVAK